MLTQDQDDNTALIEAFELFNQTSLELTHSYRALEQRAAVMARELALERSERERQLIERVRLAERMRTLLDALPGGVVVLNLDGAVTECNPSARQLLGAPLVGEYWQVVASRCFIAFPPATGEITLRNGRRVSLSKRQLPDKSGEIVLLTDCTETCALQESLAQYKRLSTMGEMAARLAHQIRTPLAAALLYISQIRGGELEPAQIRHFSCKADARLRRLERMLNDMLAFSRGERAELEVVKIETLLDSLTQAAEPHVGLEQQLHIDRQANRLVTHGHSEALLGALLNLVDNALQAAGSQGRVNVTAGGTADGCVEVAVRDNGAGIPASVRDRLFEPFFTTRANGTGLGLAVVRSVAEAHGGAVRLETGAEGTTFTIRLPLLRAEAVLPSGGWQRMPSKQEA